MNYLQIVKYLKVKYQLNLTDCLKLFFLFPVYKMRFWALYKDHLRKKLAKTFFNFLGFDKYITIRCYSKSFDKYFNLPIWVNMDNLTTFLEVFCHNAYALQPTWKPEVLIDAGANVGYTSLYLSSEYGIKNILMLEANPQLIQKLEIILKSLKELNTETSLAKGALVSTSRTLEFWIDKRSRESSIILRTGTPVKVIGKTLEDWLKELNLNKSIFERNRLLKIDIEGAEHEIAQNDRQVFTKSNFVMAEIHGEFKLRENFIAGLLPELQIKKRIIDPAYSKYVETVSWENIVLN